MKKTINQLIDHYLLEISNTMFLFTNKIKTQDIIKAWREGQIQQKGVINEYLRYELHGIGCTFIYPSYIIDFDFGPKNRIDGFDYWRLKKFSKQFPDKYPEYNDGELLKECFNLLIKNNQISKIEKNSNLYFLRK